MPSSRVWQVALLLCGSGFAALVYQTSWLRLFRLVFGSTTEATAAVLAVFMGGLGVGSYVLGKMADRSRRPLALYAWLEGGITIGALISPWLIGLLGSLYLRTGGTEALGPSLSTAVRLLLSVLVMAVPTFLMGGTLPAAVRAVSSTSDTGRRRVGMFMVPIPLVLWAVWCAAHFFFWNCSAHV